MKLTPQNFLAHRDEIGTAFWELVWLACADLGQKLPISEIAAGVGKTKRSVSENLRRLKEQGLISVSESRGDASTYQILIGEHGDAR